MQEQPKEKYNSKEILDTPAPKTKGEISFLQHNVGKRQEVQQTLLEIAFARRTDLVLIQEPSVWQDNRDMWFSFPHPSYNLVLPHSKKRPRTAIYIRSEAGLKHKVCTDLSTDSDLSILEIYGPTERFLLLNLYNEKELAEDSTTQPEAPRTIERTLLRLQLKNTPFLLAGDFNCHHSDWNTAIQNPNREATQLAKWLEEHNCRLLNKEQEQTFFRSNLRSTSIIDLAFVSGFRENTWEQWHRAEDTGSDHITIGFSAFTRHTQRFLNPLQDHPFAIQKADWASFTEQLQERSNDRQILQQLQALHKQAQSAKLKSLYLPSSLQAALDRIAVCITETIQESAREAIPVAKPCHRSKPWWTKELAQLRKDASKAKRTHEKHPNTRHSRQAKHKRNFYLHAIKAAKTSHWNDFLQQAKGKEIFKALSYTKEKTTRTIPALQYKQGEKVETAEDFAEQCTAFTTTLFSNPPSVATTLEWKDYKAKSWDWQEELHGIEVYNAITTSSPKKAPGTDKLSFAVVSKAYSSIPNELNLLYQTLFLVGYHPRCWREAVG